MAAFLPVLKIALPYITQIVTATVPMFTSKTAGKAEEVVPQQIQELQGAVTQNAESVKGLALQLKETIEQMDAAAGRWQKEVASLRRMLWISIGISVASAITALAALVGS